MRAAAPEAARCGRGGRAARRTARAARPRTRTRTRDRTLQHPRCVFQVLKRHFARYTPEMVARGRRRAARSSSSRCARLVTENSGRDRTTAFVYSLGWTQHTVGVQYIRTAAILQALLGNMGRPGGGILALRGHASIQGSTDIPTLFDLLPGYLPMPYAHTATTTWTPTSEAETVQNGFWANTARLHGQPAQGVVGRRGDRGQRLLLRLPAPADRRATAPTRRCMAQLDGTCKGYFLFGQNPAVGSANARMQRMGMANLDWLVVRDLVHDRERDVLEERPGDRDRRDAHRGHRHRGVLPAGRGAHREGRQLHQHPADAAVAPHAVEPAGDARSDLWFIYHLGRRIRAKLAASTAEMDRPRAGPDLGLPDRGQPGRAGRRRGAGRDQRLGRGRTSRCPPTPS